MDGGLQHCTGGSNKNHPKEKEMQESKVAVQQGLINSREDKGNKCKEDRESYRKWNADFQRIARRDKRAF